MGEGDSFGQLVRRRRRALDLLQKEVAQRAGCSVPALQKIEGDQRRPSRRLAERLLAALEVSDEERAAFLEAARKRILQAPQAEMPDLVPVAVPAIYRPGALPLLPTSLIGREAELTAISTMFATSGCRLLTLVGPGGIGKTRLAIEAARRNQGQWADGAALVLLASISGREQIITAIADALGLVLYAASDRAAQLAVALRDREILLVLDNFEHLAGDALCSALIADLLCNAPHLAILVTSREPLHLQAEWVLEIHGMPLPEQDTEATIATSDAVRLFVQRARQRRSTIAPTPVDLAAIARICRLVEGLPLAIELAAAWTPLLSYQEIAQEIGRSLDFLAVGSHDLPERHRSIRAALNHSWSLLSSEEQRVLRQLATFRGGCSRAAVEAVTGATLATQSALVAKSLLRRLPSGRYELHELVQHYLEERLRADPAEHGATRARHGRYYARLLADRQAQFQSATQPAVITELLIEIANLRAAWAWASEEHDLAAITQAADPLFWLYEARSNCREGVPLFAQAAESLETSTLNESRILTLCRLIGYQGYFCLRQGRHQTARELLERSYALLTGLENQNSSTLRATRSTVAAFLGTVFATLGMYAAGEALLEQALATKYALGDRWSAAFCLRQRGLAAHDQGKYDEAYRLLAESLALSRAMGNAWSIASSLNVLSLTALAEGAHSEAEGFLHEALALSTALEDRFNLATARRGLGLVYRAESRLIEARESLEQSLAIWRRIGDQGNLAQTLLALGEVLLTLNELEPARSAIHEALALAAEAEVTPLVIDSLVAEARLLLLIGLTAQAVPLLMLALEHPAGTYPTRVIAARLRDDIDPILYVQPTPPLTLADAIRQVLALSR